MHQTLLQDLQQRVARAVRQLPGVPEAFEPQVVAAADPQFGDYQTNAAMVLAKALRSNPRQIASNLVTLLETEVRDIAAEPEIAGAGFVNFRILPERLAMGVKAAAFAERCGVPSVPSPRTIVVDFSSPNIAKSMHVGHIRSTILGDALSRISAFCGHRVIRDNHIGDWGTQFGMLLLGWKSDLNNDALKLDPISEMERLYKGINARCAEDSSVREAARAELVKLQAGDPENLAIWQQMILLSQQQFTNIYKRLDIQFDETLGESFYNPWLNEVVQSLQALGIARESDGATCVFSDEQCDPKEDPFKIQRDGNWTDIPAIIQKADGGSNYTTSDLATLQYRIKTWQPDEIVYVTDGRQQLHFRQLFSIFRRWMPDQVSLRLAHVWFGSILGEDGKPFKTRSGETVKLADLLDEAVERAMKIVTEKNPDLPETERLEIAEILGIGAVKYSDLQPNRQSDYIFSWDKMLSLQGNSAPYLQYSCVRILSIFRKLAAEARSTDFVDAQFVAEHPSELQLARKLNQFGDVLLQVLEDHRPNTLTTWMLDLASSFHSFFEACPVLKAENEATRKSRLILCQATANVLTTALSLLGIRVPSKM